MTIPIFFEWADNEKQYENWLAQHTSPLLLTKSHIEELIKK